MGKNTRTFNKDFRDAKASRSLSKPRDIDYTSKMGYQDGSPFSNRPYIDINTPSGYIDMSNTGIPLFANGQLLPPYSGMHFMGTNNVREIPAAMYGGDPSLPNITGHYQVGGNWTYEADLISKVLMNRNKDKDFVKRAYDIGTYPDSDMFTIPDDNEFGKRNSHLMEWGTDDSGQAWMYPSIMNSTNEAIKIPNQYADYISSEGYKKATGMIPEKPFGGQYTKTHTHMKHGGWLDKYDTGGTTEDPPTKTKKQAYQEAITKNLVPYLESVNYKTPHVEGVTNANNLDMNCIHGICGIVQGSGAKTFLQEYTGNMTFNDNLKKEGFYNANPIEEGFEPGDFLRFARKKSKALRFKGTVNPVNEDELVPEHTSLIVNKRQGEDGSNIYTVANNYGSDEVELDDVSESDLIKWYNSGKGTFDKMLVNRYDPDKVSENSFIEEQDLKILKGENAYAKEYEKAKPKIQITGKTLVDPISGDKFKWDDPLAKDLYKYYSKNYEKIGKSSNLPPEILDKLFFKQIGIAKQESSFGPRSIAKSMIPNFMIPTARKAADFFGDDNGGWIKDYWDKNADNVQSKYTSIQDFTKQITKNNSLDKEAREYLRYYSAPSKGMFQQKELSKRGRFHNTGFDTPEQQFLSSINLAIDNYHKLENKYPDLQPDELVELTTLMHNSPFKALTKEYVDYYFKNRNVDYVNKVNFRLPDYERPSTDPFEKESEVRDLINKYAKKDDIMKQAYQKASKKQTVSSEEKEKIKNFLLNMNKKKMGGWLDDMPQAQDGRTFRRYPIEPFNKDYWANFERDMMRRLNQDTDWSLRNEAMKSGVRTGEHNGLLDAIRHAGTAVGMTNILPKALNKFPLNVIATNVMGLAHELNAPKRNPWDEFGSDVYNNFMGSLIGALPMSDEMKKLAVVSAGKSGLLSNLGDTHEFVDRGFRPWNTPRPGTTPFNPVQLDEVKITPKTQLMLNPRKSKMMYGGLPKAQGPEPTSIIKGNDPYNLDAETLDYLSKTNLEGSETTFDDGYRYTIGPDNRIAKLEKINPNFRAEKTSKYSSIPLEGDIYKKAIEDYVANLRDQNYKSKVDQLNKNITKFEPSQDLLNYIKQLKERKAKGETLDGYDDIYQYITPKPPYTSIDVYNNALKNYQGYNPAALSMYLRDNYFKRYGGLPRAQGTGPTSIIKNKADEALTLPFVEGYKLPEIPIVDDKPAWMKEYEKANPQQAYIEKQKADYLRTNPGLNKLFGVSATNFPKEVEQNFADKYLYERNSKRIEDIAKQKGIDLSDRTALLSNLSEGEKLLLANSKYQGLVKPSYISRTLAGLQDFGMRTIPGMSNFRMPVPGMTAKEIMDIKNENIFGIPTGPLQALSFMDIPGTFPANYLKNRGLSTGSDYKQMPGFGQVLPNVDDADVAAMNILNYATAAGDIQGMLSAIRSSPKFARQLATKGKDFLKRKPIPQGASGVMDDAARAAFLRTNNIDPQAIYGTQPTANVNPLEQRRMQELLDNLKENDPELYDAYMRGDYTNEPTYEYLDVKPEEQDLEELRQILRTEEDNIRNQQEGNERLLREILDTDADDTDDPFGGSGSPVHTWTDADLNDAFEEYERQRERNAALYNSLGRDPAYQAYERASRQADIDAMNRMPDPSDVNTSNQLPTVGSIYVRPVGIRDLPGPDQITDIPSRNIEAINDIDDFRRVLDNWSADNGLDHFGAAPDYFDRFSDITSFYNVDFSRPNPIAHLNRDEERDFFRQLARAIPNRLTADEITRFRGGPTPASSSTRNLAQNASRSVRRGRTSVEPMPTNGSRYTKQDAAAKVPESERNRILNMTDEEFKNTAFDVDGNLVEYKTKENIKTKNVSYDENTGELIIKNKKPLSKKDYIKKFNDNIDRLNEIIEQKNATESAVGKKYTYKVKKLTEDGQIIFETPAQHDIANAGTNSWRVTVSPGEFFGEVEDIPSVDYYKALPGIEMNITSSSVFPDYKPRKGTKTYEALNEFLKEMNLGRIKPGFNSQTDTVYDTAGNILRVGSKDVWKNFVKRGKAFGITGDAFNTIYGIMKRKGGQLKSLPKKGTSKNIKSSLNKIMARNTTLFGESGKRFYDPNVKPYYKTGGWLDDVK